MDGRGLLVSDLDGTLLGDRDSLERFGAWHAAHQGTLRLIYASGRFFESVAEVIDTTPLPEPDFVIGGVGTEIHRYADGSSLDGWPRYSGNWRPAQIRDLLSRFQGLRMQPLEFQSEFKLSYYAQGLEPGFLDEVRRRIKAADHDVDLIYSSDRDLDVLPQGVNKGSAAAFVAAQWGLAPRQVLVSGDTGNDLSMFEQGFRGIVVANAHDELRSLRSPNVYQCERPYADGVLEGVRHWLRESSGLFLRRE